MDIKYFNVLLNVLFLCGAAFFTGCANNAAECAAATNAVGAPAPAKLADRVGNSYAYRDAFIDSVIHKKHVRADVSKRLFSLKYGGKFIGSEQLKAKIENAAELPDKRMFTAVYAIDEGVLNLRVDVVAYKNFPVAEFSTKFENVSGKDSKIVSDFNAVDLAAPFTDNYYGEMRVKKSRYYCTHKLGVRYMLGSVCSPTDFFALEKELYPRFGENEIVLDTYDARSSTAYMPFFGVDFTQSRGINFAIGWTGAWKASVKADIQRKFSAFQTGKTYAITAGMRHTNFKVLAGEKLLNVSAAMLFRDGMSIRDAQNMHRAFMLAHHSPRDSHGNLFVPPVSFMTWGGHENHRALDYIKMISQNKLPYEVYWIDAGWSGADAPCPHFVEDTNIRSDWYERMGNWRINRYAHPNGISEISDAAHAAGMKMLLWFEIERINKKSQAPVITEHPEWLLNDGKSKDLLLNMGDKNARDWIAKLVCGYLDSEKIDIYRQDYNIVAGNFYDSADAPDRRGVAEMKYIEGLYEFFGGLRKSRPDMLIDNCASGGRRLDYIMSGFGIPLCQSDYQTLQEYNCECAAMQNYGLSEWLPLHAGFTWAPENDTYTYVCCIGAGIGDKGFQFMPKERRKGYNFAWHRKMLELAKRMRAAKIGANYYPLSANARDFSTWLAQQFHSESDGSGMFVCFRRAACPDARQTFALSEIDASARYQVEMLGGKTRIVEGSRLASLEIELPKPLSCEVLFYKKVK